MIRLWKFCALLFLFSFSPFGASGSAASYRWWLLLLPLRNFANFVVVVLSLLLSPRWLALVSFGFFFGCITFSSSSCLLHFYLPNNRKSSRWCVVDSFFYFEEKIHLSCAMFTRFRSHSSTFFPAIDPINSLAYGDYCTLLSQFEPEKFLYHRPFS